MDEPVRVLAYFGTSSNCPKVSQSSIRTERPENLIVDTVSQNDHMLDYKSPILPELAKNVVTADFIET